MTLPDTTIPRPTLATVFADAVEPEVLNWIAELKLRLPLKDYKRLIDSLPKPGDVPAFRDIFVSLATFHTADAFTFCTELKRVLDWPVDGELAAIFARVLKDSRDRNLRRRTIDWMMQTGMRFPHAKGSKVTVYDTARRYNRRAKVISVDRLTASATVEFEDETTQLVVAERLVA
jgi:hypothetical protein